MGEFTIFILIFAGIAVLVVAGIVASYIYEKKRREALEKAAEELGLPFFPKGDPTLLTALGSFNLFSQGRSRKITNVLHGDSGDVELGIFDYQFTTGSGKNSTTWKQTVVYFHSPTLNLPQFSMRPQSFFHVIGKVFGYQDIDFTTHPVFSKNFVLQGPSEQAIRTLFRPELLTLLEEKRGVSLEGQGQQLVFYRHNNRSKPEQIRDLMTEGFSLYKLLRSGEPVESAEPM
jgi:hypothetical protein